MINFDKVPANNRVPFTFLEFDNSGAVQGASILNLKTLALGQKLSGGTAIANQIYPVASIADAKTLFGRGSILARAIEKFIKNNPSSTIYAAAQADNGAGVAAAGKISFTGTATKAGTLTLYIGGQRLSIGVASGDTNTAIASSVISAINAALDLLVTAGAGTNAYDVNLTAKHKGEVLNGLDVRFNYYSDESYPEGVTATITAMSGGTTNPDVTPAIAAMADVQYNVLLSTYLDSANLALLFTELDDRWGPIKQTDGLLIAAKDDTLSNLNTFGNSKNSNLAAVVGCYKMPNPAFEVAAAVAGQVSLSAQNDPGRPFQTLKLVDILAPAIENRFSMTERNTLLWNGISTINFGAGDSVMIERMITTYKKSANGADDTSYLRAETIFTLSYLRYDFVQFIKNKYPRCKLAKDGIRVAAGQALVTPNLIKAEIIGRFRIWSDELALTEGIDQFKKDLVVEINAQNPDRLDILMSPDLINQFVMSATKMKFLI